MPEPDSRSHQTRSGRAADYEGRGRHRHKLAIQDYAGPWRGTIRRPVRHGHALNGASVRKIKSHRVNAAMRDDMCLQTGRERIRLETPEFNLTKPRIDFEQLNHRNHSHSTFLLAVEFNLLSSSEV